MPYNIYIPIDKCDSCALANIECCQTSTYTFNWAFEADINFRFVITNETGVKFTYDALADGNTIIWDFSAFPAGWTACSQTLYVECFDGNDFVTPKKFNILNDPKDYYCFWINFYKAVTA